MFDVAMAAATVAAATSPPAPSNVAIVAALPPASSTSLVVDMGPAEQLSAATAKRKEANDFNYAKGKFTGEVLVQWNSVKELPQNHPARQEFRRRVLEVCHGDASYNDHYFEHFTKHTEKKATGKQGKMITYDGLVTAVGKAVADEYIRTKAIRSERN